MKVIIKKLKKYEVTGGLGRLCQYPKTVVVMAESKEDAHLSAMGQIRQLITEQDFGGDKSVPMLSKVINSDTIKEVE